MSRGYQESMALTAPDSSLSGGDGGGGMSGPIMKRDTNPNPSSAFKRGSKGPSQMEHYGGRRFLDRGAKR